MVRSNNIKKYNRISGKICVLSGASTEATRIKMFLLHNPNPVKIMTNDVTSIKNIFTSPNVLQKARHIPIKLIINEDSYLEDSIWNFLKENYDIEIKKIKNVWTTLFIKDSSERINLDLYSFGYATSIKYLRDGNGHFINRGFCVKLYSRTLQKALLKWYEDTWEKGCLQPLDYINFTSDSDFKWTDKDGVGQWFSNAKISVSSKLGSDKINRIIDFSKVLSKDEDNYPIETHSKLYFFDDRISYLYTDEVETNNLVIDFYSKELIDHIMELCDRMGPKTYKHNAECLDFLLTKKEVHSNELFVYVKLYQDDDKRLMQMKNHMIETDPVNGERKFNLALDEVRNPDTKALSKMDLFYMKKNKKEEK